MKHFKNRKTLFISGALLVLAISIAIPAAVSSGIFKDKEDSLSAVGSNSGKILRWGLKRNGNEKAPDIDPGSGELLSKYGALYIGDQTKKKIYLTFDEGYENGYSAQILDVLKANNVKAIFFITGPYLKGQQELIKRMVDEGHEVGNHTVNHPSLPECSKEKMESEILDLDRDFKNAYGKNMRFLRPPKGEYSEDLLKVSRDISFVNLFWSFAYQDWDAKNSKGEKYAYDMVMNNLHNGAVLLLHAVSKDNANILDRVIKDAKSKGYEFGTPDELYELSKKTEDDKG